VFYGTLSGTFMVVEGFVVDKVPKHFSPKESATVFAELIIIQDS
jgi:hypothetical protein